MSNPPNDSTSVLDVPIRQKSANGQPPVSHPSFRGCERCRASFLGLAPGWTGERGIWRHMRWWCSRECFEAAP